MAYESLLKAGRIKAYKKNKKEIERLLSLVDRDLEAAERNSRDAPDWAYTIAYNAVLQTCRAMMFSEGYRPRGPNQHPSEVMFVRKKPGKPFEAQVNLFDQMRRKRHRVIYDTAGLISVKEAEQAVKFSQRFVSEIRKIIAE